MFADSAHAFADPCGQHARAAIAFGALIFVNRHREPSTSVFNDCLARRLQQQAELLNGQTGLPDD